MLRSRVPDKFSELVPPILGVNLRDPPHQLMPGECLLLQNAYFDGGIRPIPGTIRVTPSTLAASTRARGGHRFYKQNGTKYRLVAYSTKISTINDAGSESVLTTTASSDRITYFTTWPILDRAYACNGLDNPYYFTGSSFGQLTGTNIPTPMGRMVPILDRMMAISTYGIERTNARDDTVWSSNSDWATLRPTKPGPFSAIHPYTITGQDNIYSGLLAFQPNAYYLVTGTDFGSSVIAATASTSEDSAIQLMDGNIGTSSPQSVCTVPGVGIFWVTSDLNVYFLPQGSLKGVYIGDKLQSRGNTKGLNDANVNALDQIWMEYFDRKLLLGFPTGTHTYSDTQYWLDLRYLTAGDPKGSVWYGPQTVNTWGCVWRENQGGDLGLYAAEGNTTNGVYVYQTYRADTIAHQVGSSSVLPTMLYQDRHEGYGGGTTLKYVRDARLTAMLTGGSAAAAMVDLGDVLAYRQAMEQVTTL